MNVPVHEEGCAGDEIIIFTEHNETFSIVCEVTNSMLSHDFFMTPGKSKWSSHGTSSTVICSE